MKHLWCAFLLPVLAAGCSRDVEIIAHRGASYVAPENTMTSVTRAWELGTDAVEVDVYLSKDNRIMVIHDKDTKRTAAIAILRSAGIKPVNIENNTVVLAFKHDVHRAKMEQPENQQIAEKIIGNFLGHPCRVRCICEQEENHLVRAAQNAGGHIIDMEEK